MACFTCIILFYWCSFLQTHAQIDHVIQYNVSIPTRYGSQRKNKGCKKRTRDITWIRFGKKDSLPIPGGKSAYLFQFWLHKG